MPERPEIWLVMHHDELVAELAVERVDRLWLHGSVSRRERFEVLAPLLSREARLAPTTGTSPGWCEAYQEVRRQIRLIRPNGHEVPEFILHIAGPQASWRCIEPITGPLLEANK
jgi:hypothetical protein